MSIHKRLDQRRVKLDKSLKIGNAFLKICFIHCRYVIRANNYYSSSSRANWLPSHDNNIIVFMLSNFPWFPVICNEIVRTRRTCDTQIFSKQQSNNKSYLRSSRDAEHSKVVLVSGVLCLDTGSSTAVLQGVNFVAKFVCGTHTWLDTAVGEETSKNNVLYLVLTKEKVKVGSLKSAQTRFSLANDIWVCRFHQIAEISTPFSLFEQFISLDSSENSIWVLCNCLVTLLLELRRSHERNRIIVDFRWSSIG